MKKIKCIAVIIVITLIIIFAYKVIIKKVYPLKYSEYVEEYSEEYQVDKYLIYAIIKGESNFDKDANSSKNAIGLMQLLQETADEIGEKIDVENVDLYNEEINIKIGTKYISDLIKKYDGNINLAIIAYNAGTGNVNNWIKNGVINEDGSDIENVPYKETNMYIRKILRDYKIYKFIYEKNELLLIRNFKK